MLLIKVIAPGLIFATRWSAFDGGLGLAIALVLDNCALVVGFDVAVLFACANEVVRKNAALIQSAAFLNVIIDLSFVCRHG